MKHSLLTPAIALAFLALHAGAVAQDVVAVDRFGRTYTADQIKADAQHAYSREAMRSIWNFDTGDLSLLRRWSEALDPPLTEVP